MKPRLLVLELWGLGDLVIATPFLRAAAERYSVTLLAQPFALELRPRLWPEVDVLPFTAPWTAFHGKYRVWHWPWRNLFRLRHELVSRNFDFAVSARWDPRDHLALKLSGARERLGFSRLKSRRYLTRELERPAPLAHRYESWRVAGAVLGLKLPARSELFVERSGNVADDSRFEPLKPDAESSPNAANVSPSPRLAGVEGPNGEKACPSLAGAGEGGRRPDEGRGEQKPTVRARCSFHHHLRVQGEKESGLLLIHTGARLPLRVWPLENFQTIAARLRAKGLAVRIACDPDQQEWWRSHGEEAACPRSVTELLALLDQAGAFFGNDSGPGHLAAACGLPTFTLFGPQLHEWFAPLHPASEVVEGKACPYKPCSDYCRFAEPFCLRGITVDEVWPRLAAFTAKNLLSSRPS